MMECSVGTCCVSDLGMCVLRPVAAVVVAVGEPHAPRYAHSPVSASPTGQAGGSHRRHDTYAPSRSRAALEPTTAGEIRSQ